MITPALLKILQNDYNVRLENYNYIVPKIVTPISKPTDTMHSIVTANDLWNIMEPQLEASDFFMLMVNGQQGSGKTTVMRELSHLAHTSKSRYKLLYTSGYDIETAPGRFKAEAAGATHVAIGFDDLSYILATLSGKKQSDIKAYFAVIRHDLKAKILCIINSHFQTATPPIFRNASQWIFTKPSAVEYDTMQKIAGRSAKQKEALEYMFNNVVAIQEEGNAHGMVNFQYGDRKYHFNWNKDGRLMLLLSNGNPAIYRAQEVSCQECEHIGAKVTVDTERFRKKEDNKNE